MATAEATLRLLCTHGNAQDVLEDNTFRRLVALKNDALVAILFEFTPSTDRVAFVFRYALFAGVVPRSIDWAPLFTPDTVAQLTRCLTTDYRRFLDGCYAPIAGIAQLWDHCGQPDLPVALPRSMWHVLLDCRTWVEKSAPETAVETLLRQHIQYHVYVAWCRDSPDASSHGDLHHRHSGDLPRDVELIEACITVADRRGDRLLSLPSLPSYSSLWRYCRGVVLAAKLAETAAVWASPVYPQPLDILFASNEVTDARFVADLRHVIATFRPAVSDILTPYLWQCSLRAAWVTACIRNGVRDEEEPLQEI
jgi:hypothetical protein